MQIHFKTTTRRKEQNTFKGASSFLRLGFKCRNILCKSDCMPPHLSFLTLGLWYFTISFTCRLSHSLWFPPDVLQYTFPDRLRLRHGSPRLCFSLSFFILLTNRILFFWTSLALRGYVWRYLSRWDPWSVDAAWPASCLFLALNI